MKFLEHSFIVEKVASNNLEIHNFAACFSEASRQRAFERFELLRAHLEEGTPLAAIARKTSLSYRTLQYWLERYRTSGLAALARKPRTDRGHRRKLSAAGIGRIRLVPLTVPMRIWFLRLGSRVISPAGCFEPPSKPLRFVTNRLADPDTHL
jgi:hypothetical protein